MVDLICWCGKQYQAREADIKRGWGLSCCKSHAAIRRDYGRPKATRVDGAKIPRVSKKDRGANRITPDTRTYSTIAGISIDNRKLSKWEREQIQHDKAQVDNELGWNGHKDSF
jgi:hypothetical protein